MKFNITTLGCKVNSYESEALINDLVSRGWIYTKEDDKIDVCIVNTCTVTSMSDQKSRQVIRNLKRKNPYAIIVAMGCYVQMHEEEASKLADIIIGTHNRLQLYDKVMKYYDNVLDVKTMMFDIDNAINNCEYEDMHVDKLNLHTRGFIKIQDGCENFCNYCAIPYARGKIRSRDPESVLKEIKSLISLNTKEIILSGINTGCYGKDLGNINLANLITRIMEETSLYRLRVSSIELMEITDELLNVVQKYRNRIANHFHIPLQGGTDSVLKRMNRKYLTNEYRNKINKIREMFDDVAITTDFLAGFVGETEEEFNDAKSFIKEMNFSAMHIFPYSRREGTVADKMEGHLQDSVKTKRAAELLQIAKKMKVAYEEKHIGQTLSVIVENMKKEYWHGHTSNYLDVYFLCGNNNIKENDVINVELTKIENDTIYGIVKGEKYE